MRWASAIGDCDELAASAFEVEFELVITPHRPGHYAPRRITPRSVPDSQNKEPLRLQDSRKFLEFTLCVAPKK